MSRDALFDGIDAPPPIAADRGWRGAAVAVAICFACTLALYGSTARAMVDIWRRSDTFAHGYVVLPISLWIVWNIRAELARVAPRPAWWPLPLVAVAGLTWLLGELTAVNSVTQLALVAMLVLGVVAVVGTDAARKLAFPLGFLFFAVPVGEFLMPRLMEWTADFTVLGLRLSGIPVYREGQQFIIPTGSWSVVEACSGVRYLIASLMVGTLFAYLTYRSLRRRVIFVAVAVAVPIVANWLRAYLIVILGHISGNTVAAGADHLIYGWAFFGLVIAIVFFIGARWREDHAAAHAPAAERAVMRRPSAYRPWTLTLALIAVVAAGNIAYILIERADAAAPAQLVQPAINGQWHASPESGGVWRPRFVEPAAESNQVFTNGDANVGLFIAYYRNQNYTSKLVSSENVLVTTKDRQWAQVRSGSRTFDVDGHAVEVQTAELKGAHDERLVVWRWYWINGHVTASDYHAKALTALSRLKGQGDDSAAVVAYTLATAPGEAERALESFIRSTASTVSTTLLQTRNAR